jgi:glycosyltransferase involved in cell wall biosynthesis
MVKRRALYLLFNYPILADAYIEAEIRAVGELYEVLVVVAEAAKGVPEYQTQTPYVQATTKEEILKVIQDFKPNVLHAHRLFMVPHLEEISRESGVPFTVRSHANDSIPSSEPRMTDWMVRAPQVLPGATSTDNCLGILNFPFTRQNLLNWGVPADKLHDCRPVVDYSRFHNTSPNGDAVIAMGSYLPKKKMDLFLELAKLVPERPFKLYALSSRMHNADDLKKLRDELGSPAEIMDPVKPEDLPSVYKSAQWLVYFANQEFPNFGWPTSIGEAQAAGVGICMPNLRPDLRDYIGDAGYLSNSMDEVRDIVSKPFPEEKRQQGYINAKKSDINDHVKLLRELWDKA